MYLLSFTIIGLGSFLPGFFFPILCVRSRSAGEISMFIFVDTVSVTKSSVTSSSVSTIPWTKRQFRWEYCSSLSISFSRFSTFLFIADTFSSKFLITYSLSFVYFSYSSNFVDIKLTAWFKSFSYSSPLIWLSLALEVIRNDSFIFFSKFFIQLHKIATQSSDSNASSNPSPLLAALELESSKLDASRGLFLSSPSVELLLNSLFFLNKKFFYIHYNKKIEPVHQQIKD